MSNKNIYYRIEILDSYSKNEIINEQELLFIKDPWLYYFCTLK